jgi:hypothetical protein
MEILSAMNDVSQDQEALAGAQLAWIRHHLTRTSNSGLQVPDIPDLDVCPSSRKNARLLLPFVIIGSS